MISTAFVAYLKANLSNTRIYPVAAPNTTLPLITYEITSVIRSRHYEGGDVGSGLIETVFNLAAHGETALACAQLIDEAITLLENYRGLWTDTATSPNKTHYIADIEVGAEDQFFDAVSRHYSHALELSVSHD